VGSGSRLLLFDRLFEGTYLTRSPCLSPSCASLFGFTCTNVLLALTTLGALQILLIFVDLLRQTPNDQVRS
jgi:hypothetical protein